jgi:hypothetical protein
MSDSDRGDELPGISVRSSAIEADQSELPNNAT